MELHPDTPSNWNPIPKGDLGQAFETLKKEIYFPDQYRGKSFEKGLSGGFSFMGKTYKTLSEVYEGIDRFLDEGESKKP